MVIQAAHIFTCQHEFLQVEDLFICHKCEQARDELPLGPKEGDSKRLIFFPVPVGPNIAPPGHLSRLAAKRSKD